MQGYELAFIVDADLSEEKREKAVASVKALVEAQKGEPGELEVWGKRDFAFPIKKKTSGVYYLLYFQADPTAILILENKLKIDPTIVRHLITRQLKRKIKKAKGFGQRPTAATVPSVTNI